MFDPGFNIDSLYHMVEYIENQLDDRDHCLLYKSQKIYIYVCKFSWSAYTLCFHKGSTFEKKKERFYLKS